MAPSDKPSTAQKKHHTTSVRLGPHFPADRESESSSEALPVQQKWESSSKTLPVHDGRARLVVLALGNPHIRECTERGEDGTADPDRVLALWRRNDLDFHRGWRECRQLLRHAFADAREHCGAPGEHDIRVQVFADVDITLHDALEGRVVDPGCLLPHETRLEQDLRATEPLAAHRDDVPIPM